MNTVINDSLKEYFDILAKTIIRDHVLNDKDVLAKILDDAVLNILQEGSNDEKQETLFTAILNCIIPEQSYTSFEDLAKSTVEEVNASHYRLIANTAEKLALIKLGFSQNEVLDRQRANEILTKIKDKYVFDLEQELQKYNPEMLIYLFYGIADQLALLSSLTFYKVKNTKLDELPFDERNPFSILTALIATMDVQGIMRTSTHIGREKLLIDIIFNLIYKIYNNQQQQTREISSSQKEVDIRKIYELGYMVMKSNILLKSNGLLYEQGEVLRIKDWTLEQSGDFEEKMHTTMLDIVDFKYNKEIANKVFEEYSKREGFSPNDLNTFIKFCCSDQQAHVHLKTVNKDDLENAMKLINVKEYGVKRFIEVLTLKKEITDITDSSNKLSILPFVLLDDDKILYSNHLIIQAKLALSPRMLQQSFTKNKKLQRFISDNYDEAGIKDLVMELKRANLSCLEHVHLDKIKERHIKDLLKPKGITKEFDLVFIKNNVLYVIEYKTWKISSHNIIEILNEQKKITNNIKKHKEAMEIIKKYPNEFKELFGEHFNEYSKVELIMVFQNPTAFKYLNASENVKVSSPKDFVDLIASC